MKMIQTQYPLADVPSNGFMKGVIIFSILLIAGTAVGFYIIEKNRRKQQDEPNKTP